MTDPSSPSALPGLRYAQVRRRWFWSMLVQLLRKWAIYIVMGLAIFGAFSVGATTSMAAVMAWTVAPLFKATQWPWHMALGCALGHGLIGVLAILTLRPVMWSRAWLEAERALPILPTDMRASDASLTLLCLLPLFVSYLVGAITWVVQAPAWLRGSMMSGWAWLGISTATSLAGGLVSIAWFRRPHRSALPAALPIGSGASSSRKQAPASARPLPRTSLVQALIVLPIWRGPARGLGLALFGSVLSIMVVLVFIGLSQAHAASWGLAGLGLLTLVATARLHQLQGVQLQALHNAACATLPIQASTLRIFELGLIGLPAALAWLALPLIWSASHVPTRPAVAALYWLCFAAFHAWHALYAPHDDRSQVSRWLGALIVLTALACEVYL